MKAINLAINLVNLIGNACVNQTVSCQLAAVNKRSGQKTRLADFKAQRFIFKGSLTVLLVASWW